VRYIGSSTFPAWMVMEALAISERYGLARFSSDQSPYNLLDRRVENELIPLCQKHGLAVLPWSPLGGGILAGRYSEPSTVSKGSSALRLGTAFTDRLTRRAMEVATAVATMAQERGLTASQLALLWLKDQPGVTAPVVGPRTLAHLDEALTVLGKTLGNAERPLFDSLVHPGTAVADFFNGSGWMKARIRD
jgi:aryl-alcohol dehydrogenase-like predicted oxidoreductase